MPDEIILSGPLAQLVPGTPVALSGFAMPASTDCFALPVARDGAHLDGVLSTDARLTQLLLALGGVPHQVDGRTVYVAPEGEGVWDAAAWQARWGQIAPIALAALLDYSPVPLAVLQQRLPMILARAASRAAAQHAPPTALRSDARIESVDVLRQDTPHDGFFQTKTYRLRHPRYDGTMSDAVEREVFVLADAAIVLPYDPKRDRVLLIEQFRLGPFGRGDPHPWMLEPVAGRVDAGEAPETAARRECEEEAGLSLTGLEFITSYYCSPGCLTEYHHCYLGLAELLELGQGHGGLATEHEDIRTHVLPFEEAQALLQTGEADNAPLILMLLWLAANRDRLRAAA